MPRMLKDDDDGSDSDGESFEAVTPEHNNSEAHEERESIPLIEKHRHILEDVDGELEMEDVAPSCEVETSSSFHVAEVNAMQTLHNQCEQHVPVPFAPPLPQDVPPSSPPLPSSPPPPPPPPPPPVPPPAMSDPYTNGVDSKVYVDTHVRPHFCPFCFLTKFFATTHYVTTYKTISTCTSSHDLFNESCDLFK